MDTIRCLFRRRLARTLGALLTGAAAAVSAAPGETVSTERTERVVPKGRRLLVTITDVQRAGMVEPWRPGR